MTSRSNWNNSDIEVEMEAGEETGEVIKSILEVLGDRMMSVSEIHSALRRKGINVSLIRLRKLLAIMVEKGLLDIYGTRTKIFFRPFTKKHGKKHG